MATTKLGLPTITGNMTADVVRDMNALANAIDGKVCSQSDFDAYLLENAKRTYFQGGVQSVSPTTVTKLLFTSTGGSVDYAGIDGLQNSINIKKSGQYLLTIRSSVSTLTIGKGASIRVLLNGTLILQSVPFVSIGEPFTSVLNAVVLSANVNDKFSFEVYHNDVAAKNFDLTTLDIIFMRSEA